MRRLLLLRHAKSDWPDGTDDAMRPLADRGRRDAQEMGKAIVRAGFVPDFAMISAALRTRQTWDLASPQFGKKIPAREENGLYAATERTILEYVRTAPDDAETLIVVGHNPGIERLARSFAKSGDPNAIRRLEKKYPTCGLAEIELPVSAWKETSPPAGRLEMFLTPKTLDE
ncbi:MAG: histidine phosphatase family protein [Xanthobacteraceae bacterium]|nr:histidine phosphatase family protein [Xanthobacteraceae bacterium]MCW5679196.1 histidine phosphatase family protein [Xanthobacteraceae bacterium]